MNQVLEQVTRSYIETHQSDLDFVHGVKNHLGLQSVPSRGEYSLIQPDLSDLDLMLSASFLAQFCMDKRQISEVHNQLGINGQDRILMSNAGGGEQRGNRLISDVNFWSQLIIASGARANVALGIHIDGCGGAKVMEGEDVVQSWIEGGVEQQNMLARARVMRDAIWKNTKRRGNIEIACANIRNGNFENLTWHS